MGPHIFVLISFEVLISFGKKKWPGLCMGELSSKGNFGAAFELFVLARIIFLYARIMFF